MKTNSFLHQGLPAAFGFKIGTSMAAVPFALLGLAALHSAAPPARAGIPEPDLVWHGKVLVAVGDIVVRATTGTLVWQIEPVAGGTPWVVSTPLTNLNDQFSFLMRIPCESPEPAVAATANTVVLASPPLSYRRLSVTLDGQPLTVQSAPTVFAPSLADRGRTERIDLVLGTLPADTDGDGLADAWELQHFGNLNVTAAGDPDGDGVSNLREYRAGTNPTDPSSRFEVVEISRVPNGFFIQWTSQADRRYSVKRSANLLAPPAEYMPVQSGLAATPPINQFVDTNTAGSTQFFYLIAIEE